MTTGVEAGEVGEVGAVPQQPVEVILVKQLASSLATPVFIVGSRGEFVYFNEAAEAILGCPLDLIGDLAVDEIAERFSLTDDGGVPIPADQALLAIALREGRPAHRTFIIHGLDGVARRVSATAVPLIAQGGRRLGAVSFLWPEDGPGCR